LVTDSVDIRLEHEAAYDWIAFVPQRNSDAGALTKYFGRADDGEFKFGVTLAGRWLHISQCTDSVSASPVTKMSAGVALVPLQALMRWNSLVNRSPTEIAPYWRNLQSA
jgi:hypothetical protein